MSLLDPDGAEVLSDTALTYVADIEGKFTGVIEEDVVLLAGTAYTLEIGVDASSDCVALAARTCWARTRAA